MYGLVTEEEGLLGWGRTLQCILVAAILEGTVPSADTHVQTCSDGLSVHWSLGPS